MGTRVDVTKGRIRLTSAADASGATQTADFYGGRFTITQDKSAHPVTELRLDRPSCPAPRVGGERHQEEEEVNEVWGDGKGAFRTRGRYGSAAVRGTKWLTRDRCDATFFPRPPRASSAVRDFARRKTRRPARPQELSGEEAPVRRRPRWRAELMLAVGFGSAALWLIVWASGGLHRLELQTVDARFSLRGTQPRRASGDRAAGRPHARALRERRRCAAPTTPR